MRFNPAPPVRRAAKKAKKLIPGAVKKHRAKKAAKKRVKPKAPVRITVPLGRVPAPRPSPAAG